jgi:hypothetical protein
MWINVWVYTIFCSWVYMQIHIHTYIYHIYKCMFTYIYKQLDMEIFNMITYFSFLDIFSWYVKQIFVSQNFESNLIFYKDCYYFSWPWIIEFLFILIERFESINDKNLILMTDAIVFAHRAFHPNNQTHHAGHPSCRATFHLSLLQS